MNKWEDSFKKISIENNGTQMCHCSDNHGLFIPNRQLSAIVAVILLLAFSIFMTGYFLGKKKVVEQFTQDMRQDAVADKIYTTLLSTSSEAVTTDALLVTHADDTTQTSSLMSEEIVVAAATTDISLDTQGPSYYAQLIGFGTEKAAQLFVKKLSAKGIETEVKKRTSKTAKGNTSYWYQVVTAQYSNKDDLLHLVDKLTKEENIKDARVCIC
jgi:hypothetical protein